ncbi:MAG: FO synthase, partial [Candidatus Azotimanducaceae bacterium]
MIEDILNRALVGDLPTDQEALTLAEFEDTRALADTAETIRDQGFHNVVTYSRKVFI